ncbi:MAG: D-alanine--D-alanine ligase [Gammaproteobacteria bacterium]
MTGTTHTLSPETIGKVAVLMGGWSSERAVSLNSGHAVHAALLSLGVDAVAIDVQRESILSTLQAGNFACAFNILHGPGGEDGVIQAVLEILNIPYTGSGVLASALAMDKLRSKQLFEAVGLPTPEYIALDADADYEYVAATLGLPVMVKPALEGSSIGISKVNEVEDFAQAWKIATEYAGDVFAEQWIEGDEYTVAIVGEQALPVIQLKTSHAFYDYAAKYQANDTQYICPTGLSAEEEQQLQRLALSAFKAIGAETWGRVDFMRDQQGHYWIIEINTIPGMTDHSLVPMAARAAGMSFTDLVGTILTLTITPSAGTVA